MSDRELLEKAAKAAGLAVVGWSDRNGEEVAALADGSFWQPLHRNTITDADGDALRLAVKLGMDIYTVSSETTAYASTAHGPGAETKHGIDPYAATRRAIVRAAAAMGDKDA